MPTTNSTTDTVVVFTLSYDYLSKGSRALWTYFMYH